MYSFDSDNQALTKAFVLKRFHESVSSIDFRLSNIGAICQELCQSEKIKKVLGIILACGNHMNASNKTRCDADGFDLSILPKLKDVKSKDNTTNLVQYIAYYYVNKLDDNLDTFPLPDPSSFSFVSQVNFDELENEMNKVKKELKNIEQRIENVLKPKTQVGEAEAADLNEPFKSKMFEFLKNAGELLKDQEEIFTNCKQKFKKISAEFCLKPKSSEAEVTPEYFFSLWTLFCQDFKAAWKKEAQKLAKLKFVTQIRKFSR